jgi:glyoxylase-like metal-dependent hydrolase (beta-lactamase superfamily II)
MRVHHLNCGTMCPPFERLVNGSGSLFGRGRMVCHCLLLETRDGLVLVDTGLGTRDVEDPKGRLGGLFLGLTRPRLSRSETALAQVEALGFRASDVRHILPTHLDLDHAGGLPDFPDATVHIFAPELEAARARATSNELRRYRPAHFAHGPKWQVHEVSGEKWFGFESVGALGGTDEEVLLVPLVGHTRGHCGVAVKTQDRWLLHAGDAYFFHGEVHAEPPVCPVGLALFQSQVEIDRGARLANQARLRDLSRAHGGEVDVLSAHCLVEYERALVEARPSAATRAYAA